MRAVKNRGYMKNILVMFIFLNMFSWAVENPIPNLKKRIQLYFNCMTHGCPSKKRSELRALILHDITMVLISVAIASTAYLVVYKKRQKKKLLKAIAAKRGGVIDVLNEGEVGLARALDYYKVFKEYYPTDFLNYIESSQRMFGNKLSGEKSLFLFNKKINEINHDNWVTITTNQKDDCDAYFSLSSQQGTMKICIKGQNIISEIDANGEVTRLLRYQYRPHLISGIYKQTEGYKDFIDRASNLKKQYGLDSITFILKVPEYTEKNKEGENVFIYPEYIETLKL